MLNTELGTAFDQGARAFAAGAPEGGSPYRTHTMLHREFLRGWNHGYFSALEKARAREER